VEPPGGDISLPDLNLNDSPMWPYPVGDEAMGRWRSEPGGSQARLAEVTSACGDRSIPPENRAQLAGSNE
jgi:hypothetical protein